MKKLFFYSVILLSFLSFNPQNLLACDSCQCMLSRAGNHFKPDSVSKTWFFDFTVEGQNWDAKSAADAHRLHHQGHHFHNKTHEEFYYSSLGVKASDQLMVIAQIPYVVRNYIEIESHRRLGQHDSVEGIGDLKLSGICKFVNQENRFFGLVGGLKFPTGLTHEKNVDGARLESEFQPGSGSYDYSIGGAFHFNISKINLNANAIYTIKTKGDQNFEFGDLFSSYLYVDYLVNPNSQNFKTKMGLDANLQLESKQIDEGQKISDSGGTTILLGPSISVAANDSLNLFGNILFPVYQNLGGVHQELDYIWNAGIKLSW